MRNCYKLKTIKDKKPCAEGETLRELALITREKCVDRHKEIWYADSGANSHMTYSETGLYNVTRLCKTIIVGNGEELECNLKGDLKLRVVDAEERELTVVLTDVLYVPRLKRNLCSLSKITSITGTKVDLTAENVTIQKNGDISVKIFSRENSGNLYNMVCTRMEVKDHALFVKEKVDINVLHRRLGHLCYDYTKKTASLSGVK